MIRAAAALVCAAIVGWSGDVRADRPRIALLVERADDPLALVLAADSQLAGFAIAVIAQPGQDATPTGLLRQARAADAVAAVLIAPAADGVEVNIADRVTGKVVVRAVPAAALRGATGDQVLALHVVELLRGSLVELALPHAPRGEVTPSAPAIVALAATAPVPEPGPRYELRAGFDAAVTGDLSPAWLASTGVGRAVGARTAITLDVAVPVVAARLSDPGVEGELAPLMATAAVRRELLSRDRALRASVALGAAWVGLRASGRPQAAGSGQPATELAMAGAPVASVEVGFPLTRWLDVAVHAGGGVALPAPVLRARGDAVARWGLPFGLLGVRFSVSP